MLVNYNEYPTEQTRLIAHLLDFSLNQAALAMQGQHMVVVATQLSASAAYAGVLSILLPGSSLGHANELIMRQLADAMTECVTQAMYVTTPN